MRVSGKTLFIVSHRAKNIKKLCSRLMVLEKGRLVHDGDVKEGVKLYRSQRN
jgi:ABC-type polysaccharide/polyol phosphate transport system ATPase subunit